VSIPFYIRSFPASADVAGKRFVKFSDAANSAKVAQAAAATEPLIGVSDAMGAKTGGMCDVILAGTGEVQLGGTVAAGDYLTSDANGKAVKLVGAAGERREYIAKAEAPGVADDIISCFVTHGVLQLP
jgi:hypothetical protein